MPADIVGIRRAYDEAIEALKAHKDEQPAELLSVSKLMAAGMGVEDAEAEFEAVGRQWDDWRARHRNLVDAKSIAANRANKAVVSQLDEITLSFRETVTSLVDECRPHAEKLTAYGPEYSTDHIVSRASSAELKAYQAILEAQRKFDAIYKAWAGACMTPRRLHRYSINPGFGSEKFPFHPESTGRVHFVWGDPTLVKDHRLNGKKLSRTGLPLAPDARLILIAQEDPACRYRLATIPELKDRALDEWRTRRAAEPAEPEGRTFRMRAV